jgi:hypothetical protein
MQRRLPLAISIAALVLAVLGTSPLGRAAYNAVVPDNSVGTPQLRNLAVTSPKIRGDAVDSGKVKNRSLKAIDFALGQIPPGPAGAKGDKGDKGDNGATGLTGVEIVKASSANASPVFAVVTVSCPAGKKVIGGGASVDPLAGAYYDDVVIQSSYPITATSWQAVGSEVNATAGTWRLNAHAICAKLE